MKLILLLLAVLALGNAQKHEMVSRKFLQDFFKDKHAVIFAKLCWKHELVIQIMKSMWLQKKPKYFKVVKDFGAENYPSTFAHLVFDIERCEKPLEVLQGVESYFDLKHKWVLLMGKNNFANFSLEANKFLESGVDSDVTVAVLDEESAILYQAYKIKKRSSDIIWENYGTWDLNSGLQATLELKSKADRRKNFKREILRMGIHLQNPDTVNHLEDLRYPRVDTPTKQDYLSMKCLMDYLNASHTLITHGSHGYLNQTTGNWSGIIRNLLTDEIDIDGTGMFITEDRLEVVDCLTFANPGKVKFILRKPPLSYVTNILAVAFRRTVWFSMLAVSVFFAGALYLILNWESQRNKINFQSTYTFSDIALIILEAICQQGSYTEPRSIPGRTIMLILFLAFMFLFVSYSANVVVLLQSTGDILNLNALIHSRMSAGALNASYMVWYLHNLTNPLHKELFDKKITSEGFYSPERGVEEVRKGLFAFHTLVAPAYDFVMETFTDYEICSLKELEGFVGFGGAFFFLKKNSPYKEIFRSGMLKINEYGLQKHSYQRYERKPKCYSNAVSFGSVGILEVYQAMLILLYGIFASVFILVVEKMVAAHVEKRKYR